MLLFNVNLDDLEGMARIECAGVLPLAVTDWAIELDRHLYAC